MSLVSSHSIRWIVAQIGAREHYAVARSLHSRGHLERLYTDFWCGPALKSLRYAPQPLKSLAGRQHPSIPSKKVVAFSASTLSHELSGFLGRRFSQHPVGRTSSDATYSEYIRTGVDFSQRLLGHLKKQNLVSGEHAFFGYNTGCLETLGWLREQGIFSVVDQIDPGSVEEDLVLMEREKWPGWEAQTGRIPAAYHERMRAEWELASRVLVNSPWAAQALAQQGVPEEKLLVVPLAFEPTVQEAERLKALNESEPLLVLWLGTVNLRKGIAYLVEAARLLERTSIQFLVAGPLEISESVVAAAPVNMNFMGRVDRADAAKLYKKADVFVLPTISDGFAITQLEAMANGLPVITTPRCGEVVTSGINGFVVPPGDGAALAEAILALDEDRMKLQAMSHAAKLRSADFSLNHYADLLEEAVPVNS
ncbi:glycosyltransferase [bacterium]|nr:MAG: glycosyltransferase [bacterium]